MASIDDISINDSEPPPISRTAVLILERLALQGTPYPRLLDARPATNDFEIDDADFIFELGPQVTMLANFYSPVEGHDLAGHEHHVAGVFCDHALKAAVVADDLRPMLKRIARRAKALVKAARRRGLPVRLLGVHVAQYGLWVDPGDAAFLITIETLGQNLQPRDRPLLVWDEVALTRLFASDMDMLEWRTDVRQRLRDAGADGVIDLLSLNAIGAADDVMAVLREMMGRNEMPIGDELELAWDAGHIYSSTVDADRVGWTRNIVTIDGVIVPESSCALAIGRPVFDLVDHPTLRGAMTIKEISNCEGSGVPFAIVSLDVPNFYFNVESEQICPISQRILKCSTVKGEAPQS